MAASVASQEASAYAEALRSSLMEGLFDGEDLDEGGEGGALGFAPDVADAPGSLVDVEQELEAFAAHEVIRNILDQGCVLKEYTRDVDEKLRGVELESIQDYIAESDSLVALHDQIQACDGILGHMEGLLGSFQADLGAVSEEIRALQVQSAAMSTKLRNRRGAENRLGVFLEQAVVGEELISAILDSEVGEEYVECLLQLSRKIAFLAADECAAASAAARELEGVLHKLRARAVAKVRDFLLPKLYSLRKPKTNIPIIQQNVLLRYKYFVCFLADHAPDVHAELRAEYVATLSRTLAGQFRSYLAALEKRAAPVAGPGDVLGVAEAPSGLGAGVAGGVNSMMALFSKGGARGTNTERVFELGDRIEVLQANKPSIVPHMAEVEGKRFPYEVVFHSVHRLLADTASSEFLFCLDFWDDEAVFRELFAPVLAVVEADLGEAVQAQHDPLALLLMVRLNARARALMAARRVPALDDYLDRVALLLWPRFKVLLDAQAASLRPGVERALFTGAVEVSPLARRYAALAASCLTLTADADSDDSVFKASSFAEMLERLWASLFDTLLRMSNLFKERRQGIVFLILNYGHIKATLRAADVAAAARAAAAAAAASATGSASGSGGRGSQVQLLQQQQQQQQPGSPGARGALGLGSSGAAAIKECEDQLAACTSLYVEDQLGAHFRALLDFVKRAEQQQKRLAVPEGQPIPGYGPAEALPLLRDFGGRWQGAIQAVSREVGAQVGDAAAAREVLQASMTQLLLYYTRLLELLKRQGQEGVALAREAVNIPSIMYEIKAVTRA